MSDYQHGFVYGRSCTTHLLAVLDKWTEILDQGGAIDWCHLAKAFDTVPHQRILAKLEEYRVKGKVLQWIQLLQHFLVGRRQRMGVAGMYSAWSEVWSGVPQGSVLGLMLFVCYTNDLPEAIASCLNMYADDMKMFRKIDSKIDSAALQRNLDELGRWAEKWQLRFNTDKC